MKKLLVASSALVAAASAASALDLSLNGEIEISADINMNESGFDGANWGAGFTMKASGESMGWTYGGTMAFDMYEADVAGGTGGEAMALKMSDASVYMGGDFMGRFTIKDGCGNFVDAVDSAATMDAADEVLELSGHCVEWTGMSLGGLEVQAAMGLDTEGLIVGAKYLNPSLGLAHFEYDVMSGDYDLEIGTRAGGQTIAVGIDYNAAEEDYDYTATVSGAFGDFNYAVAYSPTFALTQDTITFADGTVITDGGPDGGKALGISVGYDCFTAELGIDPASAVDDEYDMLAGLGLLDPTVTRQGGLASWEVSADCELHDGVNWTASLGADSMRADLLEAAASAASPMPLKDTLDSELTGSIGMAISF